jgi:hypothetical protein
MPDRRPALRLVSWVLVLLAGLPAAASAQSWCANWDGIARQHLAGRAGELAISVFLNLGAAAASDGTVDGVLIDLDEWSSQQYVADIHFKGWVVGDCRLELEAPGEANRWRLQIVSPTEVRGSYVTGPRVRPVALTVTPPFDCAAGSWETFARPDWPVTFDHPASSVLDVAGSRITLDCPDPSRLALGRAALTIERHASVIGAHADGRTGLLVGPFVSFAPGEWLLGEHSECLELTDPTAACRAAGVSEWQGFTVVHGRSASGVTKYAFLLWEEAVVIAARELPDAIGDLDAPPSDSEHGLAPAAARLVRSLTRR